MRGAKPAVGFVPIVCQMRLISNRLPRPAAIRARVATEGLPLPSSGLRRFAGFMPRALASSARLGHALGKAGLDDVSHHLAFRGLCVPLPLELWVLERCL